MIIGLGIAGIHRIRREATQQGPGDFNWLNNNRRAYPGPPPPRPHSDLLIGTPDTRPPGVVHDDASLDPPPTPPRPNSQLPVKPDTAEVRPNRASNINAGPFPTSTPIPTLEARVFAGMGYGYGGSGGSENLRDG